MKVEILDTCEVQLIHGVIRFELLRGGNKTNETYLRSRSLMMDKGWMKLKNKFSVEYRESVSQFLEVAKYHNRLVRTG